MAYAVTVGRGGVSASDAAVAPLAKRGEPSAFAGIMAHGGGAGGTYPACVPYAVSLAGQQGGCGGGAVYASVAAGDSLPGEGFSGGEPAYASFVYYAGGGGGAGQSGVSASIATGAGPGGRGIGSNIMGETRFYGGGGGGVDLQFQTRQPGGLGGGGLSGSTGELRDGQSTTGGGGGAGFAVEGGGGGSGVVILRYSADFRAPTVVTGNATVTRVAGYWVVQFVTSGVLVF
jgi:hypothetical protein